MSATVTTNEITIERIFDAPIELVWRAWTVPEHFKKWWGPKIFTCPVCEIDLRVGGKFLWAMRWPDGRDNFNTGEYLELVPMKKIVFTNKFSDPDGNVVPASYYGLPGEFPGDMITYVEFEDLNGKTKMTLHHTGLPGGEMSEMTKQGWNESLDKLADSLR
ncbi:MAG TPA: SRPBCC family protein [Candidatus Kapabacteria bacterium]|nr:SRPBCC family protein [Candidatus Kapabacteria bacterium]